ncbi:hypothetical protein BT96DRAFT_1100513 [Gymnopus androsaceus JB14]|uniref:DDE-1 domain-containing protein n=1 Tax=Gymnopus androsaceus JB14 TaxID=1447944 RepID=A0A6A4GFN9_9AGAR|nr:hypothetical protein BT96DRAFT_1100513 [Gymnopus androsaceus JB14]
MNNSVPSAELCGKNKCLQLKDNNLPSVPGTMVKALFRESGNQACNVRLIFTCRTEPILGIGMVLRYNSFQFICQIFLVNPAGASISVSPKGWTDSELGSLWMQKDFIPMSAARNKFGYWILLIHDGHNSHCTYKFIALAEKHKIKHCNVDAWREAFKSTTIISAFHKTAKNYTTKSAQPIMPQLSSLLTPIPKMSPSSSSTVITEMVHVAHTASSSTSTSSTSTVASTVNFSHTRKQQYQILLPPKLKKPTAEQLVLENEALHKLAIAAGAILDVNYAQMKLMDYKNEWLRQKAFVKKKQVAVNTSATCHLTSDEMLEGLAFADHKKGMAAMFLQLKPKLKGIKKRLAAAERH